MLLQRKQRRSEPALDKRWRMLCQKTSGMFVRLAVSPVSSEISLSRMDVVVVISSEFILCRVPKMI